MPSEIDRKQCKRCGNADGKLIRHHLNGSGPDVWGNKTGATIYLCTMCHGSLHGRLRSSALKEVLTTKPTFIEDITNAFMSDTEDAKRCYCRKYRGYT